MSRHQQCRHVFRLICFLFIGSPLASAQRSEEARIASEINAARTLAAENAALSRAALQRQFDRWDRQLAAANEWADNRQSEESRRMNEGVNRYLKMVHDNEEAVRRGTAERRAKVRAEIEAMQKQWAESRRLSDEADARFAARMKALEAETQARERESERKEIIRALALNATVTERLALLRKLISQQESYWDKRAATALDPTATHRDLIRRLLIGTLDQAMTPEGGLSLTDDQRVDLYFVLRASDLKTFVSQLPPQHFCALLVAAPWAFAAHDEKGNTTSETFADLVASLRQLASFKAGGATPGMDKAADSILNYVNEGKCQPRNLGQALELAHLLRDNFKRTDEALRYLELNPMGVFTHPADRETDAYAAFLFETLMENRDRLVESDDNFFGENGVGYVTNCLSLQARIAREMDPARIAHAAPLTAIPRLQAMLRQFRNRNGYSSVWRKRLRDQRNSPGKYALTAANLVESITRDMDAGGLLERNGLFDTIQAESRDSENTAGAVAALAVLQVVEHPPAWRKTLLPEDRIQIVAAWLWAVARGDSAQRTSLLARYPAILADPASDPTVPRLDHRLFLLDANAKWTGLSATAALLELAELCDPRTGALPARPDSWLAKLAPALNSGDDVVVNHWIAVLQSSSRAEGTNATDLRRTARLVLGQLAEREFIEHEAAQKGIAANLDLLLPAGTELAPGLPVRPEYVTARMTWEKMIADAAAPLDAARAAIAGLKPAEATALAFGLMAHDRSGHKDNPLLLSSDPNFPAMILRAVEENSPVTTTLWLRLLAKAEPVSPTTKAEWLQLRTTGNW